MRVYRCRLILVANKSTLFQGAKQPSRVSAIFLLSPPFPYPNEGETLDLNKGRGMKAAAMASASGRKVQSLVRLKKKRRGGKSSTPSPVSSSPSRLLSVKHDKSVYVRVFNVDDQLEWYSFVFSASDEEGERKRGLRGFGDYLPVPIPLKSKKISRFSSCAAVGSTIYCLGGQPREYSGRLFDEVHYLDTSSPQPSWAKGPRMLNARSNSLTVALNGQIYAMGGTDGGVYEIGGAAGGCVSEPWAEVFDPKSNKWVALPSPSPKPSDLGLFSAALPGFNKVVVGSSEDDFLYLYNVMTKCWERLDKERDYGPCHVPPVAVGTTLLWFQQSKLHAYDLFGKGHYSGPIEGLEKIVSLELLPCSGYTPVLLHIAGDEFYWICCDTSSSDVTTLRCVKFRVSVPNDEGYLGAFAESCQTYLIRALSQILDAVLI